MSSLDFMFREILRKQKLLVYSHKPQKCFWTSPPSQNNAIGPKKAQNDPKIRQIQDQGLVAKLYAKPPEIFSTIPKKPSRVQKGSK